MQIIILTLLLLGLAVAARTQNFSEWWQQQKTRIKYLTEQAIALEALEKTVANGYAIAGDGLHLIGDTTNAEYHLHQDYFRSLSMVSPAISNSPEAGRCLEEQRYLQKRADRFVVEYIPSPWLSPDEVIVALQVHDVVTEVLDKAKNELTLLLSDDSLKMTDGERLRALQGLYQGCRKEADYFDVVDEQMALLVSMRRRASSEETLLKIME